MTIISHALVRKAPAEGPESSRFRTVSPGWIALSWNMVVNFFVPYGYQDEEGFHYGEENGFSNAECGVRNKGQLSANRSI
jgi:hypothetical protein